LKIEAITSALGVSDKQESEKFVSYFTKNNTGSDPELISPNDAVSALKAFVKDYQITVKEGTINIIITFYNLSKPILNPLHQQKKRKRTKYFGNTRNCTGKGLQM
jgi:hypothetical protein